MAEYKCIGKGNVDFTDRSGNVVKGISFYVISETSNVEGYKAERFFVSSTALSNMKYLPSVNDEFDIVFNRYGKIAEFKR